MVAVLNRGEGHPVTTVLNSAFCARIRLLVDAKASTTSNRLRVLVIIIFGFPSDGRWGADQAIGTIGTAALTITVANTRAAAADITTREMLSIRNIDFLPFFAVRTIRPAMPRRLQGACQV